MVPRGKDKHLFKFNLNGFSQRTSKRGKRKVLATFDRTKLWPGWSLQSLSRAATNNVSNGCAKWFENLNWLHGHTSKIWLLRRSCPQEGRLDIQVESHVSSGIARNFLGKHHRLLHFAKMYVEWQTFSAHFNLAHFYIVNASSLWLQFFFLLLASRLY